MTTHDVIDHRNESGERAHQRAGAFHLMRLTAVEVDRIACPEFVDILPD